MIDPVTKIKGSCPLNGKLCIDGVRSDFEKDADGRQYRCKWWQHVYGKDPQSEKIIDQYDCSVPWLTVTTVEGAQMSRQTAASVDKVASEILEVKKGITAMAGAIRVAASGISQAVEAGTLHIMLPAPAAEHQSHNGDQDPTEEPNEN